MKKILLLLILSCLILTGCNKINKKTIVKDLDDKIKNGYKLDGNLSISNNDEMYNYKVKVAYMKDNYYKVELTNTLNGHKQIILKNDDGVYVITHKSL